MNDDEIEETRKQREQLAADAILELLSEYPRLTPTELREYFFPPSPLAFDSGDFSVSLNRLINTGKIEMHLDYSLTLAGEVSVEP